MQRATGGELNMALLKVAAIFGDQKQCLHWRVEFCALKRLITCCSSFVSLRCTFSLRAKEVHSISSDVAESRRCTAM